MKNQEERVASTSPGTPLLPQSSLLTCPPLRIFTATKTCVCICSAMGGDPHFLRSSPLQFTSRHYCLDWPDLFPLTLSTQPMQTCFQITASLRQEPTNYQGFSWLLATVTSGQIILQAVRSPPCLSPSCVCCIMPPLMRVFCLQALLTSPNSSSRPLLSSVKLAFFTGPLWTSLDLGFPPTSLSVADTLALVILFAYMSNTR